MEKKIYTVILLIILIFFNAQEVKLKGFAMKKDKKNNYVMLTINDTLRKFREKAEADKNWKGYHELTQNKKYVISTDSTGKFNINAQLKDSVAFLSYRYFTEKYAVKDLLKMDEIKIELEPEPCLPYKRCEQTQPSKYYIFVGKKIEVKGEAIPYYCDYFPMDGKFKSVYKIEKNIYGNYPKDTITFSAYDHYGIPNFSKYENVLLFVAEYCDELYHEKYQYFDVYKTRNGKWATIGNPYKYDQYQKERINIKTKKVKFEKDLYFDISKMNAKNIEEQYPKEYFEIIDNKVIPIKGTYVDELMKIKMNGTLKNRGLKLK